MVHSTVGTPFYMSPECIQGSYYDWKSDIWSLGCLLYELATLRSPFFTEGLNYYTLGKKINKRAFEPISGAFSAEVRRAPSNPRRLRRTTARAIRATYCAPMQSARADAARTRAASGPRRPHDTGRPGAPA